MGENEVRTLTLEFPPRPGKQAGPALGWTSSQCEVIPVDTAVTCSGSSWNLIGPLGAGPWAAISEGTRSRVPKGPRLVQPRSLYCGLLRVPVPTLSTCLVAGWKLKKRAKSSVLDHSCELTLSDQSLRTCSWKWATDNRLDPQCPSFTLPRQEY